MERNFKFLTLSYKNEDKYLKNYRIYKKKMENNE